MTKRALIIGVTGQDGAYLSKFLLENGYKVYGTIRRTSSGNNWRLRELDIEQYIESVYLELAELSNIIRVIGSIEVDEIYNLAAQSSVAASFEQPIYAGQIDGVGVCRVLEAIRLTNRAIKFYQASTSEMFGKPIETPQTERTPFYPRSPYAVAKLYGHWTTVNFREAYNLFACSGILFNHDSPLRGPEFVTRKTTISLAEIRHGVRDVLQLGNLDAKRDWGFAGDYVTGMWQMLQAENPEDYVLATGTARTVRDFVDNAATCLDFDLQWEGTGENERGIDRRTGKMIVQINPRFYRPVEAEHLVGNPAKAVYRLGWKRQTSFEDLVQSMIRADYDRVRKGKSSS
jgi:GDPmannose 4,6-dehydratase